MLFGIMCNGTILYKWEKLCLEKLLALDDVKLGLIIIDEETNNFSSSQTKTVLSSFGQIKPNRLLLEIYGRFISPPDATRKVDASELIAGVPTIQPRKSSLYFSEDELQTIRSYKLDFILQFGFNIIRGDILKSARYGVWSFHHGDEQKYRGHPPCFWEIYNNDPVTVFSLQKLTNQLDKGIILKKGIVKTFSYSYRKNADNALYQSAHFAAQVCLDILNNQADYLNAPSSKTKAPIYYPPNNDQMLIFLFTVFRNYIQKIYHNLFYHEEWNVGIVHQPIHQFLKDDFQPHISWLPYIRKNKFFADPFGIHKDDKKYILMEDFDYSLNKGVISSVELTKDNRYSNFQVVFERPSHLSYPFVFEYNDEIYCLPENQTSEQISLYKIEQVPHKWTKVATLIEGVAALDASIFQYNDLWWIIFYNLKQNGICIWYASTLFDTWKPHALNPVKIDVRSSRPAGTPFIHEGKLYRPTQDCSITYGGSVVINQVLELSPTKFKEEPVATIKPNQLSHFPDGLHTISSVGNITLVDGKRFKFTGAAFRRKLLEGFSKIKKRLFK